MGLQPPRGATDMQRGTRGPAPCPRSVDDDVLHTDRATDPGIFRSQTTPMRQISSLKVMETWLEVMGHDVTLGGLTCHSQGLPAGRVAPIWATFSIGASSPSSSSSGRVVTLGCT